MLVDFIIGVIDLLLCFLLSGNVNLELMKKKLLLCFKYEYYFV